MFNREQCALLQALVRHVKITSKSRYFVVEVTEIDKKKGPPHAVPVDESALMQLFNVLDPRVIPANARVYAAWRPGGEGEAWRLAGPYASLPAGARELNKILKDSPGGPGAEAFLGRVYPLTTGDLCLLAAFRVRPRRRGDKVLDV